MDVYNLLLFLVLVVAPIGTLIHEGGHAIGALLVRADHINLSIGLGKKIGTISFRNFQITVHMLFFLGGFVQSYRNASYRIIEVVCITLFGPINNGLFAILFYLLDGIYYNQYIHLLFLFNLWLALMNIIPYKIKGKQSDGYTILRILLDKYIK